MKVLIITKGFLESTLSLANALGKKGIDVELLCINFNQRKNLNVFNFTQIRNRKEWLTKEDLRLIVNEDFYSFLSFFNIKFHFKKGDSKNPVSLFRDAIELRKYIKAQKADIIHIIQGSVFLGVVAAMLPKNRIVFSLHEVTHHWGITPLQQKIQLNFILRNSYRVIVHSEISKNRFVYFASRRNRSVSNPIHVIYFGLFEVYNFFESKNSSLNISFNNPDSKVFLFFGRINASKGLNVLLTAFKSLEKEQGNIHLIVAGSGYIDFDIGGIKNLTIINRPLSNEEIVHLMKISHALVCPYLTASQSGIPMTGFLFGKPIIATKVGAFEEVIIDRQTGLLISPNDINALKKAMVNLASDQQLYKKMTAEIEIRYTKDRFNWDIIADQTISVYNDAYQEQKGL